MDKKNSSSWFTLDKIGDILSKFAEKSEHVYWISSPDFKRIEYVSPSYERVWGRTRESLYADPELWITFLHPEDAINHHPIHEMASRVKRQGEDARYSEEYRIIRADGEIRWIIDNGFPVYDANGNCLGVAGIAMDVTSIKKAEIDLNIARNKAEAANRAKTEFIANMSHDIRTPLTGVIGISEILEQLEDDDKLKQYARDIHDCGLQLLTILNGVLDVISADHMGDASRVEDTFNLKQCIQEVIDIEKPTLTLHKLLLTFNYDEKIPQYITTDRGKLYRILLNLFGNAIKFTHHGSITIDVKCVYKKGNTLKIHFAITDTGIGISSEKQDKVFDRFFKGSPSYKGEYTGHGIGLHIAQLYAKQLGSKIKLLSQEGMGTTFYFELVCSSNKKIDTQPNSKNKKHTNPLKALPNYHWLLIEDNPIALKVLENCVSTMGIQFTSVTNGECALDIVKKVPIDLVLSDIGLPGMSGTDFTEALRVWEYNEKRYPIPVIAVTAHAQEDVHEACKKAGMNDVYSKPISTKILQKIIATYLNETEQPPSLKKNIGIDLPNTENELFQLEKYTLIDTENALSIIGGNTSLLKNVFTELLDEEIPNEIKALQAAYNNNDWDTLEKLAHRIKGGAEYTCTFKMKIACQYFERYCKTGRTELLEKLYTQMINIIEETRYALPKAIDTLSRTHN